MGRESNRRPIARGRRGRAGEVLRGLEVLRWAHGGEGVCVPAEGRLAGAVVFASEVVPGDVVDLELVEERGRWARGKLVRVVRASEARVPVPCAVQARCGGCPWMPGSAEAQAASRRAILEGELRKRLGLSAAEVRGRLELREAPARLGYRQRLRLAFEAEPGRVRLGFLGRKSHELVEVARCEVADERLNAALPEVRARLASWRGQGRVTLVAGDEGVAGLIEGSDGRSEGFGAEAVRMRFGPFSQSLSPRAFVQANAAVTGQLLETLLAWARAARGDGADDPWAVELFAGAGTLTLALWAAGWRVAAYEVAEAARAAFEATRQAAGVAPERSPWYAADLAIGLPLPAPPAPRLVVLDPPRTGAAEVIGWVRASGAAEVIYVSCDLATGLRDLQALTQDGRYRVERIVGLDMFPHSGHQEVMFLARRSSGATA